MCAPAKLPEQVELRLVEQPPDGGERPDVQPEADHGRDPGELPEVIDGTSPRSTRLILAVDVPHDPCYRALASFQT